MYGFYAVALLIGPLRSGRKGIKVINVCFEKEASTVRKKGQLMEQSRIEGIQLFELDYDSCFHQAKGTLTNCRYGVLRIRSGSYTGWGECMMSTDSNTFDIIKWASFLDLLKLMTIGEALEVTNLYRVIWGDDRTDMVQTALLDLYSRQRNLSIASYILLRTNPEYVTSAWSNRWGTRDTIRHIHPGEKGTLIETIAYAHRLSLQGYSLAIHKDYLIGPACSALKLLSNALGAQWIENKDDQQPLSLCTLNPEPVGTGFDMTIDELFQKARAYYGVLI